MKEIPKYSKRLKPYVSELRNNMTYAEVLLWSKIEGKQILDVQFYRQKPIQCYILDFYAKKPHMAIEVDGPIHNNKQALSDDSNRDFVLQELGIHVIRFTNEQILSDINRVINEIKNQILKYIPLKRRAERG